MDTKNATETIIYARAVDKVGNVSTSISNKGTTTAIIGAVEIEQNPAPTKSDGTVNWTNGNVSVTLSYTNIPTGYVIQYSLSGEITKSWTTYSSEISVTTNNTTVKARLYNASVEDEVAVSSKAISNIDKTVPSNATITLSGTSTNTISSITATVEQEDTLSGLDITNCKWIYNTTSTKIGTDPSKYNGGSFTSVSQNLTLKATTGGMYYLHVLSKDAAGNYTETISDSITVAQCVTGISISGTKSVIISEQSQLTANISPSTAANKTVTWSSSDTTVATVSSTGLVSTLKSGTTTITATATDGSGIVGSTTFTVNKDSSVKILLMTDKRGLMIGDLEYYFTNITQSTSMTASEIIAGNYDVIIDDSAYGSGDADLINELFAAGENLYTIGNDSKNLNIISSSSNTTLTGKITKNVTNSVTENMWDSYTLDDDGRNRVTFVSGTEVWYTETTDGETGTYHSLGCLKGSKGNKWIHSQWSLANLYMNEQQVIYYILGK